MILNSITLSGWRCFARELHLGPLGDGLNIIYGPNGTGKSTLLEALARGVLDAHGVQGRQIEALVPWGRDLAPSVALEFTWEKEKYRLRKQFVIGVYAQLEQQLDGVWEPVAEGRAADVRIREIISRNPPARGLARRQHRGWAQVLWAPQNEAALSALSDDLAADLRGVLDAQLKDPLTTAVLAGIQDRYAQYYTASGRLRRGRDAPEIGRWEESLAAIQAQLDEAEMELQRHGELSSRIQAISAQGTELKTRQNALLKEQAQLEAAASQFRDLSTQLARQQSRAREAQAHYQRLQEQRVSLENTEKELHDTETLSGDLTREAAHQEQTVRNLSTQEKRCRNAVDQIRAAAARVQGEIELADLAQTYLANRKIAADLEAKITRINQLKAQLAHLAGRRRARPAPDPATLKQIRNLVARSKEIKIQQAAQGVTLEVTAEREIALQVAEGDPPAAGSLSPGDSVTIQGTPQVSVAIPGVARLKVTGPQGDWAALATELTDVVTRLDGVTAPFGTSEITELEALASADGTLAAKEKQAHTALGTLLGDGDLAALQGDWRQVDQVLAQVAQRYPEWVDHPPDGEHLRQVAQDRQKSHYAELAAAEKDARKALADMHAAQGQLQAVAGRLSEVKRSQLRLQKKITELKALSPPRDLAHQLNQRLMAWEAARKETVTLQDRLEQLGPDPEPSLASLAIQLKEMGRKIQGLRDESQTARGELVALSERAPYNRVAELREAARELELRIARQTARREAIGLLYATVEESRRAATIDLALPVVQRAGHLLQQMDPDRWAGLTLGEHFEPATLQPAGIDQEVSQVALSGGEKEQLHLAVRLALAEVLADGSRQLLVLDDPLPATDPQRLQRAKVLLEETARSLQVVILTCHPQRYEDIHGGQFFDLARLKACGRTKAGCPAK